jgi:hypothetical protein
LDPTTPRKAPRRLWSDANPTLRASNTLWPDPGRVSANGSCHLLEASDGWIALNLARDEDWQLIPAWLEGPGLVEGWDVVAAGVKARSVGWLLERGRIIAEFNLPC